MDLLILLGLLGLALLPRLSLLILKGFEIFHSDHAVFGLMAKHILEGKLMVYYYGQGYMGSLEAFVGALIDLIRGMDILSVQFAPLSFFLGFLIVNFYLLKRLFGLEVSLIANLLLALSPPSLSLLSVTALGGYPETLFFGSLVLLGFVQSLESKRRGLVLFLTGLAAGIGFWVNNLILMYFLAMALFGFLRSGFWKREYEKMSLSRLFFLRGVNVPSLIRVAVFAIHLFVALFVFWNVLSSLVGDTLAFGNLKIEMASPPFHVKKVKKILLLLGGELIALSLILLGPAKLAKRIKPMLPPAGGFLLGVSPALLYSLFGGEGYRLIHGSGMILAKDFAGRFRTVVWKGLVNAVWGVPTESLFRGGVSALVGWGVLALSSGLVLYFGFRHRKELYALVRLRPQKYSYPVYAVLHALVVLAICLFNNLESGRYLIPLYFSFSAIFALTLSALKRKNVFIASLLLFCLLASNAFSNFKFIKQIPKQDELKQAEEAILRLIEKEGIRGGYAHYVTSYVLTFLSREKIIFAPYRSPDRYPPYTEYVNRLDRVAYVLQKGISWDASFEKRLDENKISHRRIRVEPFEVFLIDREKKSEKGIV